MRAATLTCESLVAGGLLFTLVCLGDVAPATWASCRKLIRWAAAGLAIAQLAFVFTDAAILRATVNLSLAEVATADFFVAGMASAAAAVLVALGTRWIRAGNWTMLIPGLVMLGSSVMTSHSAARMDHRVSAMLFTALHQGATMAWIGGLPFLLISLPRGSAQRISGRFSRVAQVGVALLFLSGLGLAFLYVGSVSGAYETSYGIMVLGKVVLFLVVFGLGGLNFFLVRDLRRDPVPLLARLRRFSEAEIGIGFTIILAAASLTSQPPAIDVQTGRVTPPEIAARMTPHPPRLTSPQVSELTSTSASSRRARNIAWSEYNHNYSGMVVLAVGLLAVASRVSGWRFARHWPLAFLGLAFFLFVRADADAWPLGARGFWRSLTDPEILQHRMFALLIVAFAVFEWGIQNGRIRSRAAALVFPGVCALGGALLLTHSHALVNVKEEYLAELSHLPIAICAVVAGWSRWLEQRLDGAWRRFPSTVWPVCFVMIGLILLFYREA
jgi:putative copper resistance protein D